ncbi:MULTISPECIES: S-layer homology domain-containing protein [unclassified Leptolyngbya]|uniref:S-layer homology domain-containing protein n=1 Tax=unclassified Leptolyngbya TaxID=2650499 RepID=UPI0016876374|nr:MULTISPECIES: S-layer homology domain-containing protein [unclassified Leptolyngbya]MBD1911751.1 S-layer homology domain-containing protein [Leptolyngbya sp. FACHB-8]MBD2158575.1 S-layer homology domain-containing protein [Leptolyngbya sp. FACHB-16]
MSKAMHITAPWSLAIAGLTAFTLFSTPAQSQTAEASNTRLAQSGATEVEMETQTIERTESQTIEVQTTETQVQTVEVETSQTSFTQTVQVAVFQAVAQRANVSASNLRIVEVSRRSWRDSCLGLNAQENCSQVITPGYLVTVTDGQRYWVCRTNANGSAVYYDERATEIRTAQLRVQSTQISFSDVQSNYWAARFIRELAALDIIAGYPDGLYRPNEPVTRAEFAAIIRRAFNVEDIRDAIAFVDVDEDYWAAAAIDTAYERGFLNVVGNREFRPLAELYRGDVLFAIARGFNFSTQETNVSILNRYSDVTVSSAEARLLLAALTNRGVMTNYPNVNTLDLERVATRAEVAVLVYQTLYSMGYVARIDSPYVVQDTTVVTDVDSETVVDSDSTDTSRPPRQNCNQGIGNGAEGCDPGNSQPHGGSNDEGGRTPGNRP